MKTVNTHSHIYFSLSMLLVLQCFCISNMVANNVQQPYNTLSQQQAQTSNQQIGSFHNINQIEQYNNLVTNKKPSVIYCHTETCDACKESDSGFEQAAKKYNGYANFLKVNLDNDKLKTVGSKNEIEAVPTVILKDSTGKTQEKIRGSGSGQEYVESINTFLNNQNSSIKMAQHQSIPQSTPQNQAQHTQVARARRSAPVQAQNNIQVAQRPARKSMHPALRRGRR